MSNYILAHAAWPGVWCWYKIVPLPDNAGHTSIALDLPALGRDRTAVRDVSLHSYVDHVCRALDGLPGRAILVGHGVGGIVTLWRPAASAAFPEAGTGNHSRCQAVNEEQTPTRSRLTCIAITLGGTA